MAQAAPPAQGEGSWHWNLTIVPTGHLQAAVLATMVTGSSATQLQAYVPDVSVGILLVCILALYGFYCLLRDLRVFTKKTRQRRIETVVDHGVIYVSQYGERYHDRRDCQGLRSATTTVSARTICAYCEEERTTTRRTPPGTVRRR